MIFLWIIGVVCAAFVIWKLWDCVNGPLEVVFLTLISGLIGFVIALIVSLLDYANMREDGRFDCVVVGNAYAPPSTSVGTGFVSNGNGGISPVVTTSSSAESYRVIVKEDIGHVHSVEVSPTDYVNFTQGKRAVLVLYRGAFFGVHISHKLVHKEEGK